MKTMRYLLTSHTVAVVSGEPVTNHFPSGLKASAVGVPPLTENWKDFIHDQRWQRRWVAESRDDRALRRKLLGA